MGSAPRLPSQPWELTAPESYVLRHVGRALPETTGGFGIYELIARGALRMESARVRRGLGARERWLITDGDAIDDVDEPALRAALKVYASVRGRKLRRVGGIEGVALEDLVKAARRDYADVDDGAVAVGLRKRGLLSRTTRSATGDRANGLLDEWLRIGRRRFAEWSHDEGWTSAFLAGAGSVVLLLKEPAAVAAFADSKIAGALGQAFPDLDVAAAAAQPLGYAHRESGGGSWGGSDGGGWDFDLGGDGGGGGD